MSKAIAKTVDDETAAEAGRVRHLPKEVGVLLITAGIGGLILPGPVGSPFLVAGCLILWPRAFARVETYFERKFPRMHREGVKQMRPVPERPRTPLPHAEVIELHPNILSCLPEARHQRKRRARVSRPPIQSCTTTTEIPLHESWQDLRVGERIRLVAMPSEFAGADCEVHPDTQRVYGRLIATRRVLRINEIDERGLPWIAVQFREDDGRMGDHDLAFNHDGWVRLDPDA